MKYGRWIMLPVLALLLLWGLPACLERSLERHPAVGTNGRTAKVVGVGDGDSLTVLISGRQEKMRLASIDAPELSQPFGRKSKKHLSDLVFGKEIRFVEMDRDRYHRLVAVVWVDEVEVNLEQLKAGYAWNYTRHEDQLDGGRRSLYRQAEKNARSRRAGLWAEADRAIPPWSYRKSKR